MSVREFSFPWRGKIIDLHGDENVISFITKHDEELITPFYSVDLVKRECSELELPSAAIAMAYDSGYLIACRDKTVCRVKDNKLEAPLYSVDKNIIGLSASSEEVFILTKNELLVVSDQGKLIEKQSFEESAVSFAVNADHQWLAVGTATGEILAFSREEKGKYRLSGKEKVHSAAVTNCLFDKEELLLFSTGADKKMMMTYLRGEFEINERSSKGHEDQVSALFHGPEGHFYTAGRDASVKLWAGGFNRRAGSTAKALEAVEAACWWNMGELKVFATAYKESVAVHILDEKFKIKAATHNIHGIESWVTLETASLDTRVRLGAIKKLASFPDGLSVEKLANQALYDQDAKLRLEASVTLTGIDHKDVDPQLVELLRSQDQQVHISAFQNLLQRKKLSILEIVNSALLSGKKGLGLLAIEVLSAHAVSDSQSLNRLIEALDEKFPAVRLSALTNLEKLNSKDPVQAIIYGTASKETDVRSQALKLGYHYKLLDNNEFLRLIRRHLDDSSLEVRLTAFVLSILTRPALADYLRGLDEDIQRRLYELDGKTAVKPKAADLKKLVENQRAPLVEAMATPSLDICLLGARCLSLIKDPRAFGVLLQLSRESDESTRIHVCKAFSSLGERNAIQRLRFMLHDNKVNVADAAFSALNSLQKDEPHAVIEAGFNAPEKKIRLRAVAVTARLLKKDSNCETTVGFLEKALHDKDETVRREAFKTVLNSTMFEDRGDTLRFALKSSHTDIRNEVLLELESKKKESWSLEILSEMLDDSNRSIRHECFELFRSNHKDSDTVFTRALSSKFEDVRLQALDLLLGVKKKTAETLNFIDSCLNDESAAVRNKALNGLIQNRCMDKLAAAVKSQHQDVSVRAACAQAEYGLESALTPLMDVLKQEEPEKDKEEWKTSVRSALSGIASLAMPESFDEICNILESEQSPFKPEAATVLRYVCRPGDRDRVYELFQKASNNLQPLIGQALAVLEDDRASSSVFGNNTSDTMTSALLLRNINREYLYSFMDNPSAPFRKKALLLGLMTELAERPETPAVCLAGLSAARVDTRLAASRALDAYADRKTFLAELTEVFNDRNIAGEQWQTDSATINELASVISLGDKTVSLLICEQLLVKLDCEEDVFKHWWETARNRFEKEIGTASKLAAKNKISLKREALLPLAIGTYVGILRLKDKLAYPEERLLALKSLAAVVKTAPDQKEVVATCLKVALHDRLSLIRMESFNTLAGFTSVEELSSEAIAAGHRDIAAAAMKLLIKKGKVKDTKALLNEIQLTYTNGIEEEAYSVLSEMEGLLKCNGKALEARSESLRKTALHSLFNQIESQPAAKKELHKALESKFTDVEQGVAGLLAYVKDSKALPKLVEMLNSENNDRASAGLKGLRTLQEAKGAEAILDLVAVKPEHKLIKDMFGAAVRIGNSKSASRMIKLISEEPKLLEVSYRPMLYLTGYSQKLKLNGSKVEVDEQEPRDLNENLFLLYLKCLLDSSASTQLAKLLPMTVYCKSKDFDPILESLSGFQSETVRERAVEAQGRRVKEFGCSRSLLVQSLGHEDAQTKFLAAEGLALCGFEDGIQILLTGMEMLSEFSTRERCVLALGQLANPRALDQLLRLAVNTEHALQEPAIEAIGHMKDSEKSAEIFELLKGCVNSDATGLKQRALEGLRWFNSPESWHLIRREAREYEYGIQEKALSLLGFDNASTDESKSFLVKILIDGCYYVADAAKSLLKLCEKDPMTAYYAFLKSDNQYALRRAAPNYMESVCKDGDAVELINALNSITDSEVLEQITNALLSRSKLPVKEITALLEESGADTAAVILQLVLKSGAKVSEKQLSSLTMKSWEAWKTALEERVYSDRSSNERLLERLSWYAAESGVVPEKLADVLSDQDEESLPVRRLILIYLENCKLPSAYKDVLCELSIHGDSELRSQSLKLIAKNFAKDTKALWEEMVDSPESLNQLESKSLLSNSVLLEKAAELGVGMMNFKESDVAALAKAVKSGVSDKAVNTLIETLSRLKSVKAEKALSEIIKDKKMSTDIQKAAARALSRSKRQRSRNVSDDWTGVTA